MNVYFYVNILCIGFVIKAVFLVFSSPENIDSDESSQESSEKFYATEVSTSTKRPGSFNIYKLLLKVCCFYFCVLRLFNLDKIIDIKVIYPPYDNSLTCRPARFSDYQSNIQHLEQLGSWGQILSAHDTQGNRNEAGICDSLKNLGLYNLLWAHLQGVKAREGSIHRELSDVQYECGWRLSNWEINSESVKYLNAGIERDLKETSATFQQFVYESIQAGLRNDQSKHNGNIQR
jgi:hypothetical protein